MQIAIVNIVKLHKLNLKLLKTL